MRPGDQGLARKSDPNQKLGTAVGMAGSVVAKRRNGLAAVKSKISGTSSMSHDRLSQLADSLALEIFPANIGIEDHAIVLENDDDVGATEKEESEFIAFLQFCADLGRQVDRLRRPRASG
jgi:hypothetical protein